MKRLLLLAFAFLLFASASFGQTYVVTGTVYDQARQPLPGVNILLKGTSKGTISDIDGKYSLEVPADGILVFSFIGYVPQEEKIQGRSTVYVLLKEDQTELQAVEIVDIGYGTQQSKDLTTAISSVRATDLEKTPVPSLDQAMQGRMAGVQVFKNTGAPGGAVSVRIRGTASIFAGQEPLYIVDGVPINNTATGSTSRPGENFGGQTGNEVINGLAGINMDDIEKIDVLKDAAAASIYGARAANGVVLITTKRGKSGTPALSINILSGAQAMTRRYDLLNAQQYAAAVNEGLIRLGGGGTTNIITETPFNTDWQDAIFQIAPMFSATAQVSGGNERIRYMTSVGYFNQQGIIINSGFDRFSYRANLDYDVSDRVKVGTSMMFSLSNNVRLRNNGGANVQDAFNGNSVFGPSILGSALVKNPNSPIFTPDGRFFQDSLTSIANPVALARQGEIKSQGLRMIGNMFLEYKLTKQLSLRTSIGIDMRDENETYYQQAAPNSPTGATLVKRSFRERIFTSESVLKYDRISENKKHSYNFLVGVSTQNSAADGFWVGTADIPSSTITTIQSGSRELPQYSDPDARWGMLSFFSRAIYDFNKKYYLTLNIRTDGSSRFGPDRRFGFFPGVSGAWRVSKENFYSSNVVTDFKIRGSWGMAGNDQIGAFEWRARGAPLAVKYLGQIGVVPISIVNETYSWETNISSNLGFDFDFLNGRFGLVVDVYQRRTNDLLLPLPLPRTTGFGSATKNIGDMVNRGLEFMVTAKVLQRGPFAWNAAYNMAFNRNEVLDLVSISEVVSGNFGFSHVAREGFPIGAIQLYQLEATVDPETGRRRIKDLNGNGARDGGDLTVLANALPIHIGGFTNNFTYGRFDGSVFFNWSYGNYLINNTRGFVQDVGKSTINAVGTNLSTEALGRWTRPGDVASFPGIDYSNSDVVSPGSLAAGGVPTDQNLEDGSFLRLRAIQIGYNLPRERAERAKLSSVRFNLTVNNLLTLTRYSGYDPEVSHNFGTNIAPGIDSGTYPNSPKTITLGINIGL
ncbi:MAG: TonB-dependent receptor [Cyclobacteriaceae bacterium]|jgi:TonB-linked SusC/RagA family outer membrane protein|nr:TonB-dependent receptor [Cyclobacteriaceae bacterium]